MQHRHATVQQLHKLRIHPSMTFRLLWLCASSGWAPTRRGRPIRVRTQGSLPWSCRASRCPPAVTSRPHGRESAAGGWGAMARHDAACCCPCWCRIIDQCGGRPNCMTGATCYDVSAASDGSVCWRLLSRRARVSRHNTQPPIWPRGRYCTPGYRCSGIGAKKNMPLLRKPSACGFLKSLSAVYTIAPFILKVKTCNCKAGKIEVQGHPTPSSLNVVFFQITVLNYFYKIITKSHYWPRFGCFPWPCRWISAAAYVTISGVDLS